VIADELLASALARALGARVASLERRPSDYRTSFGLEELDAELEDGRRLELMFKDLARSALHPRARDVKPEFVYDPLREIEVYRDVLDEAQLGTPRFHGAVPERGWLFVERVAGFELYRVGERETWEHVARWLARMHARLEPVAGRAHRAIRYDEAWYRRWPARALAIAAARGQPHALAALERIVDDYDRVIARLLALPTTLIHGEFYASNVLVDDPDRPRRVAPVDWEQAAIGPGLVDLAALTAGRWSNDNRRRIAAAYREAAADGVDDETFALGLEACRLHLALQWLGWSAAWSPPAEQRQDWLEEASRAAARLG
jgi:hypothetical protein